MSIIPQKQHLYKHMFVLKLKIKIYKNRGWAIIPRLKQGVFSPVFYKYKEKRYEKETKTEGKMPKTKVNFSQ